MHGANRERERESTLDAASHFTSRHANTSSPHHGAHSPALMRPRPSAGARSHAVAAGLGGDRHDPSSPAPRAAQCDLTERRPPTEGRALATNASAQGLATSSARRPSHPRRPPSPLASRPTARPARMTFSDGRHATPVLGALRRRLARRQAARGAPPPFQSTRRRRARASSRLS